MSIDAQVVRSAVAAVLDDLLGPATNQLRNSATKGSSETGLPVICYLVAPDAGGLARVAAGLVELKTRLPHWVWAWVEAGLDGKPEPAAIAAQLAVDDFLDPVRENCPDFSGCRMVVLTSLTRTILAKLALAITDTSLTLWTYAALSAGVPVVAVQDSLFPETAPCPGAGLKLPGMAERIEAYRQAVLQLGVQLLRMTDLVGAVAAGLSGTAAANSQPRIPASGTRRVITVEDLASAQQGRLVLGPGVVISPLARDEAARLGIQLAAAEE